MTEHLLPEKKVILDIQNSLLQKAWHCFGLKWLGSVYLWINALIVNWI